MAWVYITLGLSDLLVRGTSLFTPALVIGNAVLVACYASIALCFRYLIQKPSLTHPRYEFIKLGGVLVLGAALTAVVYVTTQTFIGALPQESAWDAIHRFFIGDCWAFLWCCHWCLSPQTNAEPRNTVPCLAVVCFGFWWRVGCLFVVDL